MSLGYSVIVIFYLITEKPPGNGPISISIRRISKLLIESRVRKYFHVLKSLNNLVDVFGNLACNLKQGSLFKMEWILAIAIFLNILLV